MAGARHGAGARLTRTGLLGGSFNPAHGGHRRIALAARRALALDEVWLMVSPGNPLKEAAGDMAPLAARYASAQRIARRTPLRATAIEAQLGTRYTAETIAKLVRRFPRRRFVWIMGADNLGQLHRWRAWRRIARTVTIAVVARPGYDADAQHAPAMGWLRRFVRPASQASNWTTWSPPALVLLRFRPDPSSATRVRALRPDWPMSLNNRGLRDRITRRPIA